MKTPTTKLTASDKRNALRAATLRNEAAQLGLKALGVTESNGRALVDAESTRLYAEAEKLSPRKAYGA